MGGLPSRLASHVCCMRPTGGGAWEAARGRPPWRLAATTRLLGREGGSGGSSSGGWGGRGDGGVHSAAWVVAADEARGAGDGGEGGSAAHGTYWTACERVEGRR